VAWGSDGQIGDDLVKWRATVFQKALAHRFLMPSKYIDSAFLNDRYFPIFHAKSRNILWIIWGPIETKTIAI
jgi:hypothetical protein